MFSVSPVSAAARFGRFGGKDDGATLKAALLSGPPGVGKTTTAALVCQVSPHAPTQMQYVRGTCVFLFSFLC